MARAVSLGAAATLDGVIESEDHWTRRHKGVYQKAEQHLGGLSCRPAGPIQHPMVVLETRLSGQPQGA
jgi:hypothetical protein